MTSNNINHRITIIGGGLAGCEAAWQAAERGIPVDLFEMKPNTYSPAHNSSKLAELVCSNSFRAAGLGSAVGLLKEEMRMLGSLLMDVAAQTQVPAGRALAVDRERFAALITEKIESHPLISLIREEVETLPPESANPSFTIISTGPLSSEPLAASLQEITGEERLSFYDAIAPIVSKESLNQYIVYRASRYEDGPGDYLNCPMNREQYQKFITEIKNAVKVPLKSFEKHKYFEGCLPIEVMIDRGENTLRFGPMKPVGLPDPKTGAEPFAVVQLRQENLEDTCYNMVGFQTKLTYAEQKRIFRMIPGMENAEFLRLGSIHRNTFVCAPLVLQPTLQLIKRPDLMLAGQLSGVEGYVESTAMGLLAGINSARIMAGNTPAVPPEDTAHGALIKHLTKTAAKHFQPSNINFGLFPALNKKIPKKQRGQYRAEQALQALRKWINDNNIKKQE